MKYEEEENMGLIVYDKNLIWLKMIRKLVIYKNGCFNKSWIIFWNKDKEQTFSSNTIFRSLQPLENIPKKSICQNILSCQIFISNIRMKPTKTVHQNHHGLQTLISSNQTKIFIRYLFHKTSIFTSTSKVW